MSLAATKRRLRRASPARSDRASDASHAIAHKLAEVNSSRFPRQFSQLSAAFTFACAERFKPDGDPSAQVQQLLLECGFRGVFLDGSSVVECTPLVAQPVFPSMELTRFLIASIDRLDRYAAAQLARGTPTGIVLYLYGTLPLYPD
jgi:hypothetical protein